MNGVAQRVLDLRGRNGVWLCGAIQQHADPIARGPQLTDPIEQSLRVAHRRHVWTHHQVNRVGAVERGDGARVHLRARIDDDVFVLTAEYAEDLFKGPAVCRAWPVEEITIAGNLKDMYRDIVAVGNDVLALGSRRTGSILVGKMAVAGD